MENTTKIIIGLENVVPLPIREESEVNGKWVYSEFPYKHLLPKVEVA